MAGLNNTLGGRGPSSSTTVTTGVPFEARIIIGGRIYSGLLYDVGAFQDPRGFQQQASQNPMPEFQIQNPVGGSADINHVHSPHPEIHSTSHNNADPLHSMNPNSEISDSSAGTTKM